MDNVVVKMWNIPSLLKKSKNGTKSIFEYETLVCFILIKLKYFFITIAFVLKHNNGFNKSSHGYYNYDNIKKNISLFNPTLNQFFSI